MTTPPDPTYRSQCPIARTLDLVGDRWTLVIMRDILVFKRRTYAELASSREKIPTNLLASRLKKLVGLGLLEKVLYQERPKRYRYEPTETGRQLRPVLRALRQFGERFLDGKVTEPTQ